MVSKQYSTRKCFAIHVVCIISRHSDHKIMFATADQIIVFDQKYMCCRNWRGWVVFYVVIRSGLVELLIGWTLFLSVKLEYLGHIRLESVPISSV